MKHLRKIILALCLSALCLSLLLCGCGDESEDEKNTKGKTEQTGEASTLDPSNILPWDFFG